MDHFEELKRLHRLLTDCEAAGAWYLAEYVRGLIVALKEHV